MSFKSLEALLMYFHLLIHMDVFELSVLKVCVSNVTEAVCDGSYQITMFF